MHVFLDESGDLGWEFGKPFRKGGSSRFFTLAFLVVDNSTHKYPRRIMKKLRMKYRMKSSREIKGAKLTDNQLMYFAGKVVKLRTVHPDIMIEAITVKKENVQDHIREDSNKLYNFMVNLCLPDLIEGQTEVLFTPDPRSIKVASGNSMVDYLQTQLWFERGVVTKLIQRPSESHSNLNLQFIDVIAHIIWSYDEDKDRNAYRILAPMVSRRRLFFG